MEINVIENGGLYWIDVFSRYAMWLLMPYLTDGWMLNVTDAAIIVNLWSGAKDILPMGMFFLADSHLGYLRTIRFSVSAFAAGLVFLFMSTLDTHTELQIAFLCTALVLTAVGIAGYTAVGELFEEKPGDYGNETCVPLNVCGTTVIPVAGSIAIAFLTQFPSVFGVAALCTIFAAVVFLNSFSRFSEFDEPETNRLPVSRMAAFYIAPLCLVFAVGGLVLSIGDTYFIEQATHLSTKVVGPVFIPIFFLRWSYYVAKGFSEDHSDYFRRWGLRAAIAISLVLAALCCLIAAGIEAWRLDVVVSHGLIDKPDETIPMSILWMLLPNVMLGVLDGLFRDYVKRFIESRVFNEIGMYLTFLPDAVFGLGTLASALTVYTAKVVTEKDGAAGWFGDTLNESRLDKYYLALAVICSVNLLVFGILSCFYSEHRGYEELSLLHEGLAQVFGREEEPQVGFFGRFFVGAVETGIEPS